MSTRIWARWVALATAGVLSVAGCGSSADNKDATGESAAAEPATEEQAAPSTGAGSAESAPAVEAPAEAATPAPAGEAPAAAAPAAGAKPAASSSTKPAAAKSGAPSSAKSATPSGSGGSAPAATGSGSSGSTGGSAPAAGGAEQTGAPAPGGGSLPGAPASPAAGSCAPVTIGSWGTTTGPLGALFGAMTPAAKAWVASVNAKGGLRGCHQVKLIVGDDGDDPARAKAVVRKMVEEDKVMAFVAHHGALTLGAVRPYLEEKRVPLFGSSGAYADESESEMVFLAQPTSVVGESEAYINNVLALDLPNRKIAVFWCAEVPLCSVHNDVIKKQAPTKGFQVVASIRVSLFAPDYTSEVLQARQSGADMIILLSDMQTNGRLLRSAKRQNYSPLVVTPGVTYDSQWPSIIGRDADGMVTTAWSRPWHIDGINKEYRQAVTKFQPGQVVGNSGSAAWAAMKLVEKAAANLDPKAPTSAQLIDGVYALSNETLGGLIPPTTWPRDSTKRASLHPCTVPVRWTGTAFELPLGEKFVCSADGPGFRIVD
jgi:branched-chain amino acid transport system substrate-binding protein